MREQLGVASTTFLLMYMGSLGSVYLLKEMFAFFQAMKHLKGDCKFLFLGQHKSDQLLKSAKDQGFDFDTEDILSTNSKRDNIPNYCAAADAGICFITPTYSSFGCIANQVWRVLSLAGYPQSSIQKLATPKKF